MFESLRLKPDAFGIDISDYFVRLIKLKKTGKDFELTSYNEEAVKPGVIENGEIRDRKEFGEVIKKLLNNVNGEQFVLLTHQMTNVPVAALQDPKESLEHLRDEIIAAVVFLVTGI